MNNLIDREQAKLALGKWLVEAGKGNNVKSLGQVLDDIPIAYDIDNVVKELSKELEWAKSKDGSFCKGSKYTLIYAIDVVKDGVIDE